MHARITIIIALLLAPLAVNAADDSDGAEHIVFIPTAVFKTADTQAWTDYFEDINSFDEDGLSRRQVRIIQMSRMRYEAMKAMYGETPYTEFIREPLGGDSVHEIDCRTTTYIGLTFIAGWSKTAGRITRFGITYRWEHSAVKEHKWRWRGQKRKGVLHSQDSWWIPDPVKIRERQTFTEWLQLDDASRVDGVWTLTLSHRGTELHRESFELSNCGDGVGETSATPSR
ncbi:MAG: hypothetical protein AAGF72_16020 [Pseudomonadota bacterium]